MKLALFLVAALAVTGGARRARFQDPVRQAVATDATGFTTSFTTFFQPPPPPPPPPTYQPVGNTGDSGRTWNNAATSFDRDYNGCSGFTQGRLTAMRVKRNPTDYSSGVLARLQASFQIAAYPNQDISVSYQRLMYQTSSGGWSYPTGNCYVDTAEMTGEAGSTDTEDHEAFTLAQNVGYCNAGLYDQYTWETQYGFSGKALAVNAGARTGYIASAYDVECDTTSVVCSRDGDFEVGGDEKPEWFSLGRTPMSDEEWENKRASFDEEYEGEFDELHVRNEKRGWNDADSGVDPVFAGNGGAR